MYEIVVSDHTNSGTPQLYMKTDQGFECIDVIENKDHSSNQTKTNKLQETSVVYTFCLNKLQVKYYFAHFMLLNFINQ